VRHEIEAGLQRGEAMVFPVAITGDDLAAAMSDNVSPSTTG
jgi:hypothetical protein